MSKLTVLTGFAALAAMQSLSAGADEWNCKFSADRTANVPATGVTRLVLGAGAGDLKVRGEAGRTSVQADGRACAPTEKVLAEIKLESRREGDTVYLKTVFPSDDQGRSGSMDLTVALPDSIAIALEDASGDIDLRSVRTATVADSSGEQTIRDIGADLEVTDSSGDIVIDNVGGNLKLKDSSGDVHVEEIKGNVTVTVDSSGELDIRHVGGGVHILNDSSGEIVVSDVQQDVKVDVDSSGGIRVSSVGGNFTVDADASGDIHHDKVLGKVQVPQKR
jgi:DUF4097 and DUF4098 domain-containing protein YvlB